jgi:hypothetical protein
VSKNYHRLNIDISTALKNNVADLLASKVRDKSWDVLEYSYNQLDTIFNTDWLTYMKNLNLDIVHTLIFYRAPASEELYGAHVDLPVNEFGELSASINWGPGRQ